MGALIPALTHRVPLKGDQLDPVQLERVEVADGLDLPGPAGTFPLDDAVVLKDRQPQRDLRPELNGLTAGERRAWGLSATW